MSGVEITAQSPIFRWLSCHTERSCVAERSRSQNQKMKAYTYILQCSDGSYYTGSTIDLERRLAQHQKGEGANHTKKHLPVKLVYMEEHVHVARAFKREKQIQGWTRAKKEALIKAEYENLAPLSECRNETHYKNKEISVTSAPFDSAQGSK